VPYDEVVQIPLSTADICRLADGLNAHEYWELGDLLPRNNGEVFIPAISILALIAIGMASSRLASSRRRSTRF